MIICGITETVCQNCTTNCKHQIKEDEKPVDKKKGDKNDNSK